MCLKTNSFPLLYYNDKLANLTFLLRQLNFNTYTFFNDIEQLNDSSSRRYLLLHIQYELSRVSEANEVPISSHIWVTRWDSNSSKSFKKIVKKLKYIFLTIFGLTKSFKTMNQPTQRKKKESLVTKPSLPKESLIIPEESMHFIRRSSLIFW